MAIEDNQIAPGTSQSRALRAHIQDIPLTEIDPFPSHPYKVQDDEDMASLVDGIQEHGVITPAMVRQKADGRYELISGHRRKRACELAQLKTLRCEVVELSREEAVVMMVDANCQRSKILPSEKAFAYKMKLEALKQQGKRTDLTSGQAGEKLAADRVSDTESGRQVQRYIRLTCLEKPLLDLVDDGRIALSPAVELSYLSAEEQYALIETIESEDCTPSLSQASRMRKISADGTLTMDSIFAIMREVKSNQVEYVKVPAEALKTYFRPNATPKQIGDTLIKAMEYYNRHLDRKRAEAKER